MELPTRKFDRHIDRAAGEGDEGRSRAIRHALPVQEHAAGVLEGVGALVHEGLYLQVAD
jgi:hypothetical protein